MDSRKFCQSCGMPLDQESDRGRDADGSLSEEYCRYCWKDGAFADPEITMEQMIAFNLDFNEKNGYPLGTREEAQRMMEGWFPTLKRWKKG